MYKQGRIQEAWGPGANGDCGAQLLPTGIWPSWARAQPNYSLLNRLRIGYIYLIENDLEILKAFV